MNQIKFEDKLYKLPSDITGTDEIMLHISSLFGKNQKLILSFNQIFLSRYYNYDLLEIGYSPQEYLEVTKLITKKAVFNIDKFDYHMYLSIDQYSNVFMIKKHFASLFYTVPQNIIIKYEGTVLSDSDSLLDFESNSNTPFQISVEENYILVRTYVDEAHFVCMPKSSKIKDLNDTISVYFQENKKVQTRFTYSDNLLDQINQNKYDTDSTSLEVLSLKIPFFEFTKIKSKKPEVIKSITVIIEDDQFNAQLTRNYQISCQISLYFLTVLIEKDLGIDRSLFLFDQKNTNILDNNSSLEFNKFTFKISKFLHVKVNESSQNLSYLTTIKDIQQMNKFDDCNFGIIANNHYVYFNQDMDQKFLLINFMNDSSLNELSIKKAIDPIQKITFIKEENKKRIKKETFLIPKNMKIDQIAKNYLHQNPKSIKILSHSKNEIIYTNSNEQLIDCVLFAERKYEYNRRLVVKGDSPRVIDIITALNEQIESNILYTLKKIYFNNEFNDASVYLNDQKLSFLDPLSSILIDNDEKIKIKFNNEKKEFTILNLVNNDWNRINNNQFHHLQASEIISKYGKDKDSNSKNIKLYADFNELRPTDVPTRCNLENNILIFNEETNQKTFVIKNLNNISFELNISKKDYSKLGSIINDIFMIPNNKSRITASLNKVGYLLPPTFNAGSFPDRCEIIVQYEYQNTNKLTFRYEGQTIIIEFDHNNIIENIKPIIQRKFNLWHISKRSIYFKFFNFNLSSTQSFSFYHIPESAIITICLKDNIFPINISTPEIEKFGKYLFNEDDKIDDVIKHFESKFSLKFTIYEDKEKTKQIDPNLILYREMNLYLSCEPTTITCVGIIGSNEIKINGILKVKEAVKFINNQLKSKVFIFTKNKANKCYEAVDEEKQLYEFDEHLYVHKISNIDFNFKIFENKEYISELNTIGWLKKTFICKSFLANKYDFIILDNNNKPLNDNDLILDKNKLIIEFSPEIINEIENIKINYNIIIGEDPMNTISLDKNATVKDVILKIAHKNKDIDPKLVSLFYNEKKLKYSDRIIDLKIQDDEFLQVVVSMPDDLFNKSSYNVFKKKPVIFSELSNDENNDNDNDFEKTEEDEDDDENNDNDNNSEENEEEIFKDSKKRIFRFLSVSFINKLHKEQIGRGATSDVFKVSLDKYPTKVFALKVFYSEMIGPDDDGDDDEPTRFDFKKMKRLYNEYEILTQLDHPNIIKAYGLCIGNNVQNPAILLEYCPYNLKKVIKKLNSKKRIEIIYELSQAMAQIHEAKIIHCDLKPENILIDESYHVKVSDFGICTFIKLDSESISNTLQFAGTLRFMAPELLNESNSFDEKVDVYSFGVIVYWIINNGNYPSIKYVEIANGKQAEIPKLFTNLAREIIQKCWSLDPKNRPSFREICEILKFNNRN